MKTIGAVAVLGLGALMFVACGGGADDADSSGDEQDVTSGSRLVGRWTSTRDAYTTDIRFQSDGTFIGDINRPLMGAASCASTARPCTAAVLGKWRAVRNRELVLTIPRVVEVTDGKTITLAFKLSSSPKALELEGENGVQMLEFHDGCGVVECGAGEKCAEQLDGTTACVSLVPHG